jgi:hypothetical protein
VAQARQQLACLKNGVCDWNLNRSKMRIPYLTPGRF